MNKPYIPFHKPTIPKKAIRLIEESFKNGWLTTGSHVNLFESQLSGIIKNKNVVSTSSCTAALHTAYMLIGIQKGDEVIVPSFTFCATVNMIVACGGTPVFVDISKDTYCIDPKDIEHRITNKTKAIVVVHYAGMPADMTAVNEIARKYNLFVVEDAAHALGAIYKGKQIGLGKNITCFSFYATKNLTTAEGGLIACRNNKDSLFVRMLINHGMSKIAWNRYKKGGTSQYDVLFPGYKYNMSDIHASIGIAQINLFQKFQKKRRQIVQLYRESFKKNPYLHLQIDPPYKDSVHAWHLFTLEILPGAKCTRDDLLLYLKNEGVGVSVHYIPNHLQSFYKKKIKTKHLPVTEMISNRILSIPLYEKLTVKDISRISHLVNKATLYGI